MSSKEPLNLEALGDRYEIMGELAGRSDARTYIARDRQTGAPLWIAVHRTPAGDEGNALSHLAADVNLLKGCQRDGLLGIVDGVWVGDDAFAVVSERTTSPTLEDLLARRDEEFSFSRIASVLQQVNATLEWAREQKVVHRAVGPETIFVEPGSDRTCAAFIVAPLPLHGVPDAEADARAIAVLARAMLTRSPVAPEREAQPLAELRPGLPASLVAETEALLAPRNPGDAPRDPSVYIAHIAMADALRSGEEHLEETRNIIEVQKREHRDQIEKERREHDEQIAKERAAHQEQIAKERSQHEQEMAAARKEHERMVTEQARQFEKERSQHEQELAAARKEHQRMVAEQARQFQKEREHFEKELAKERAALVKEREKLTKEIAAHARDREQLLTERTAHEREVASVRERLEWETAALASQAEAYARTAELRTPPEVAPVPPTPVVSEPIASTPSTGMLAAAEIETPIEAVVDVPVATPIDADEEDRVDESETIAPIPVTREYANAPRAPRLTESDDTLRTTTARPFLRRGWTIPLAVAALLLVVLVTALAVSRRGSSAQTASRGIVDSVGGVDAPPITLTSPDSSRTVAGATIDTGEATPEPGPRRSYFAPVSPSPLRERISPERIDTAAAAAAERSRDSSRAAQALRDSLDSSTSASPPPVVEPRPVSPPVVPVDSAARRDTSRVAPAPLLPQRDSVARPKPDSTVKRDSTVTLPVRRDTVAFRP